MRKYLLGTVAAFALMSPSASWADMAAAERWIDSEFQPSTLSREDQVKEMQWFIDAAKPFSGMEINVLSEGVPTHTYESETLTKAFEEITGIKVNHRSSARARWCRRSRRRCRRTAICMTPTSTIPT